MGEGEDGKHNVLSALELLVRDVDCLELGREVVVGGHDALGEACGAGRVAEPGGGARRLGRVEARGLADRAIQLLDALERGGGRLGVLCAEEDDTGCRERKLELAPCRVKVWQQGRIQEDDL